MAARRFKFFSRCEGAAAVEFAIILPVLMLILAGLIDFGWLFYWQHTVTNASREGARYGVQAKIVSSGPSAGTSSPYSSAEIQSLVRNNYGNDLTVTSPEMAASTAPGTPRPVTVTKTMTYLGFLANLGVPLPTSVQSTTTLTME